MIGIYRIRNLKTQSCYYGSSEEIEKRWESHIGKLRKNLHENVILQRAWNKYREENFIFEVMEECEKQSLLKIEQLYLDLNPKYNIGLKASGGDNISKNPKKNDIIKTMKENLGKTISLMSKEERKEKYSRPKDKNPNWKGGKTLCKCGNNKSYKAKTCIKCKDVSGENNSFFEKKHSEKTKKKIAKKRIGKYFGNQNYPVIINGIKYGSAGQASKKLKIPMVTIRWRILSKNPKFKEYKYL